ncbi:MAG: cation:proton antiporter [Bacteroidia bacterium]
MAVLITICSLLLIAYIFDLTAAFTKVPSVILLLLLGFGVKELVHFIGIPIPNLEPVLPILGTIGLILIVLEGSLELELNKSKLKLINKSFFIAIIPLFTIPFLLAYLLNHYYGYSFRSSLVNMVPLFIISSAIAIPSARHLSKKLREFVTYESSLSDIIGVIFFNFITLRDVIDVSTFGDFFLSILIIIIISFVATIILSYLISHIKHHIKFAPIVLLVIIIYAISKIFHLPSLVFIMFFGLFIGNIDELKRFKFINKLKPEILDKEVSTFKDLISEFTFLTRALFFLLFGFLMEANELLNIETIPLAATIIFFVFITRLVILLIFKMDISPLLYIAPRGLITILLFLSIPSKYHIDIINNSLIIQVIIISAFAMMFGLMGYKKPKGV